MRRWEDALRRIAEDPMQLHREVDWVAKRKLILEYMSRHKHQWDDPQVQMMDLQYHDLRPEKGLYAILERRGDMDRIVTDERIEQAMNEPPPDTRAYFRGECIRRFGRAVFGVNWDSISFNLGDEQKIKRIFMNEPLKGTRAHVQDLLDSSSSAAELVRNLTA
jgi:proteasome accessory factor A